MMKKKGGGGELPSGTRTGFALKNDAMGDERLIDPQIS